MNYQEKEDAYYERLLVDQLRKRSKQEGRTVKNILTSMNSAKSVCVNCGATQFMFVTAKAEEQQKPCIACLFNENKMTPEAKLVHESFASVQWTEEGNGKSVEQVAKELNLPVSQVKEIVDQLVIDVYLYSTKNDCYKSTGCL